VGNNDIIVVVQDTYRHVTLFVEQADVMWPSLFEL